MRDATRNMLVGLFMVTGLAVVGALMVMFGEAPDWLGGAELELVIRVDQIGGIDEGTPIYLNGIKVGRVASLYNHCQYTAEAVQTGDGFVCLRRSGACSCRLDSSFPVLILDHFGCETGTETVQLIANLELFG